MGLRKRVWRAVEILGGCEIVLCKRLGNQYQPVNGWAVANSLFLSIDKTVLKRKGSAS